MSTRKLLLTIIVGIGAIFVAASTASAAVTATFQNGQLTIFGDALDNTITISRDAAGKILVNNGAVAVLGGTPTVANTAKVSVFGLGGNDQITLNEANGALPAANLLGGAGNDVLTGGSGADQLFGESGNDTPLGNRGNDLLFGGADNDVLTGGDGDDQVFGQSGNDRMIWNPGDDTDLNEGGDGSDTVEVNGGNGDEAFAATANGTRVRFDRLNPAPFAIDMGTDENLVLNANGGTDSFSATGNLAALIKITVDGGAGNDTLLGGNGADVLFGGDGNDVVDGNQGDDVAFLGAGDDQFIWDPGDGNDTVEGQDGVDGLAFNGANIAEKFDVFANGQRERLTRDVGNIVLDLNSLEFLLVKAKGGADNLHVGDLSGTGAFNVIADLAAQGVQEDGALDNVIVDGTSGADVVTLAGAATNTRVSGLSALITISGGLAPNDRLTVNGLAGDDVIDADTVAAGSMLLTLDGGDLDDILIGGAGDDTLLGGAGDDVLIGGLGNDTFDGGDGSNIVIDDAAANTLTSATLASTDWIKTHVHTANGKTVIDVGGKAHALPHADLSRFIP